MFILTTSLRNFMQGYGNDCIVLFVSSLESIGSSTDSQYDFSFS